MMRDYKKLVKRCKAMRNYNGEITQEVAQEVFDCVAEAADAIEELSKPHMIQAKRKDNGEVVTGFYFCIHHNDNRKHLHHFVIPNEVPIPKDETIGNIQVEIDPKMIQIVPLPELPKEEI